MENMLIKISVFKIMFHDPLEACNVTKKNSVLNLMLFGSTMEIFIPVLLSNS